MSVKIIGYSSDDAAFYRHGGEKPKRKRWYPQVTQAGLLRKNIKPGKYKCCYCEISLTKENYTRDHLVPIFRGGRNRLSNLRPCCKRCNDEKGNMMLHTYIEWLILHNAAEIKINNAKLLLIHA